MTTKPQIVGRPKKVSREKIVSAALKVMEREGFSVLSMRSLARELGINHATLYNYFDSIEDVEQAGLDELMTRIPMPDRKLPIPMRQQLIEHLLAIRQTQLLYPKFCHAPAGTRTWRLHMSAVACVLDNCCENDDQIEDVVIAYNALVGLVATNAERSRVTGRKVPVIADLEAIAALPRDEFEPLFRPLATKGGYSKRLSSFVYRLDDLISRLLPHLPALSELELAALHQSWVNSSEFSE